MAKKPPIHVLPRDDGWAVVREGRDLATSVHPTQAEATEAGRAIARNDGAEFLLHARDGRVRDRSDYSREPHVETPEEPRAGTVGDVIADAGAAAGQAIGGLGQAIGGSRDSSRTDEASEEGPGDTEETRSLADARSDDRFAVPEERYAGYEVHDADGVRISKVDILFLDENDNLEYLGIEPGPLGTRAALIPSEVVEIDDRHRRMVVSRPRGVVENGPSLGEGEELTSELEGRVRDHYGLPALSGSEARGGYDAYYRDAEQAPHARTEPPERGISRGANQERSFQPGGDPGDENEVTVQRSEEELRVDTREREAGAVNVRKRVRTDRERLEIPRKREEVTVERVPIDGDAPELGIGEEEIVVPVMEEELVVEKRLVAKEEVRVRKRVVEEVEVVEEDVRREEVDIDDETTSHDL